MRINRIKRVFLLTLVMLLTGGELFFAFGQTDDYHWRAGVSKVKITPGESMWLAGYGARTKPSEGTMHHLWAKALWLEDVNGNQALLITTDLLGFSQQLSRQVKSRLEAQFGLSDAQIILSSSHTHSGPVLSNALTSIYPLNAEDQEKIDSYTEELARKILDLALDARKRLQPAALYAGNGVVRFQVNRRNNPAALVEELTELKGPNNFDVPVLKVVNKKGKMEALLFGYACHPTVLSGYEWSGDYPGFAQLELEKRFKGTTAMFFQGAGADQNPLPRRSVHLARQYGQELAAAVERVLNEDMRKLKSSFNSAYSEIDLILEDPPSADRLKKTIEEKKGSEKRWAEQLLARIEAGESIESSYPYPVQLWQLGDQTLAALGGELLVWYAIQLKTILGKSSFIMGYANDVMAYIPSEEVLKEGGYEGQSSQMVYGLPAVWKPGIEETIVLGVADLARQHGFPVDQEAEDRLYVKTNETEQAEIKESSKSLIAEPVFSGFDFAHDTYNALSRASDGKIYYVLSSQLLDTGGQFCVYDPATGQTSHLGDLTEMCGEKGSKAIVQGKSHVRFYETGGKLYFSTHVGFYEMIDGMERLPVHAPEGHKLYPGGHFLSYDIASGAIEDLGLAPEGEGVLTMTMDRERMQIYAITWPMGYFVHLDLTNGKLRNMGLVSEKGEGGTVGDDYRVLCRSMFVDPRNGKVYYSTAEGDIWYYDPAQEKRSKMEGVNLRLDYFGKYDYTHPGSMAYNWRQIFWHPDENVAYGVHGNSGYLFKFDPRTAHIEIVQRITSVPSQKSGMFDYFSYGYLGFDLGPDGETIYYLTGGPIYENGRRVKGVEEIAMGAARGLENLHLITYHIPSETYTDHGAVVYADGSVPIYVNSIAIGTDGSVYTLARFMYEGKEIQDLIKIPNPFK